MNWKGKVRYPAAVNLLALVTLIREIALNSWEFFLMCFCACSSKWLLLGDVRAKLKFDSVGNDGARRSEAVYRSGESARSTAWI